MRIQFITSVPSKLCTCAHARSFQRLRTDTLWCIDVLGWQVLVISKKVRTQTQKN